MSVVRAVSTPHFKCLHEPRPLGLHVGEQNVAALALSSTLARETSWPLSHYVLHTLPSFPEHRAYWPPGAAWTPEPHQGPRTELHPAVPVFPTAPQHIAGYAKTLFTLHGPTSPHTVLPPCEVPARASHRSRRAHPRFHPTLPWQVCGRAHALGTPFTHTMRPTVSWDRRMLPNCHPVLSEPNRCLSLVVWTSRQYQSAHFLRLQWPSLG